MSSSNYKVWKGINLKNNYLFLGFKDIFLCYKASYVIKQLVDQVISIYTMILSPLGNQILKNKFIYTFNKIQDNYWNDACRQIPALLAILKQMA